MKEYLGVVMLVRLGIHAHGQEKAVEDSADDVGDNWVETGV